MNLRQSAVLALALLLSTPSFGNPAPTPPPPVVETTPDSSAAVGLLAVTAVFIVHFVLKHYLWTLEQQKGEK